MTTDMLGADSPILLFPVRTQHSPTNQTRPKPRTEWKTIPTYTRILTGHLELIPGKATTQIPCLVPRDASLSPPMALVFLALRP